MNKKLLLSALLVATQNLNIVAQQNNEPSELGVDVMITDNQLEISINFNESFRWENTKYDSIKKFDMRDGGKMPHTINFDDSNNLRWRQTDVVFIGTYQIKQISAEELLTQYIEKHGGFGESRGRHQIGEVETLLGTKFQVEWTKLNYYSDNFSVLV